MLCDDRDFEKVAKLAKINNFGLEFQSFSRYKAYSKKNIAIHKKELKGISPLSMHGLFPDLNPGSSDPLLVKLTEERFNQTYKLARELGATSIVYHLGYVPGTGYPPNWAKRTIKFWNKFLRGKSTKINFYIENVLDHTPEVIEAVIGGLNRPNVKACLDLGHAHAYSKTSVIEWIKTLKDKIGYVHIHNNYGLKDDHNGIDKGTIPMISVLNALKRHSPTAKWALETNINDMSSSIKWLKEHKYID